MMKLQIQLHLIVFLNAWSCAVYRSSAEKGQLEEKLEHDVRYPEHQVTTETQWAGRSSGSGKGNSERSFAGFRGFTVRLSLSNIRSYTHEVSPT